MTQTLTISSIIPKGVIAELQKYGFSDVELTRKGISLDFLQLDPDARFSMDEYLKMEESVDAITGNKGFFLDLGKGLDPLPMVVKYVILHSADNRERIKYVLRYLKLICEAFSMCLEEFDDRAAITLDITPVRYYSIHTIEMIMANIMCGLRSGYQEDYHPIQINFQHSPPHYQQRYNDFFGVPVCFEQSENRILFHKNILTLPHSDQPYLKDIFVRHAEGLLDKLSDSKQFSSTIRKIIIDNLTSSNLSIRLIESSLNMSRQTIHRKLKEENTTYEVLLNEIRENQATEYLKDKKLSIEEIAFLLGYSETSAFYHAFKKWFQKSPSQYRGGIYKSRMNPNK